MEAGEFFGLTAFLLALITITWILAGVYKRRLQFKERQLELQAQAATARNAPTGVRNDLLEERVRVLERIATDRGQDVAIQIEALRDQRAAAEQRNETRAIEEKL